MGFSALVTLTVAVLLDSKCGLCDLLWVALTVQGQLPCGSVSEAKSEKVSRGSVFLRCLQVSAFQG